MVRSRICMQPPSIEPVLYVRTLSQTAFEGIGGPWALTRLDMEQKADHWLLEQANHLEVPCSIRYYPHGPARNPGTAHAACKRSLALDCRYSQEENLPVQTRTNR